MALNSIYRVRTQGTYRNQAIELGAHVQQVTAVGGASDLAGAWANGVGPLVIAATSADVNWRGVLVTDTNEAGEESYFFGFTQPSPGTQAGESLPNQNAAVVRLLTGVKGRRRRGRFYVPGITETANAGGSLTGTQLTAIQALGTGMIGLFGPAGSNANYRLVVYSPPTPAYVPKPPPPSHSDTLVTPVTAASVDTVIRTQRRRAIGVGR